MALEAAWLAALEPRKQAQLASLLRDFGLALEARMATGAEPGIAP